MFDWNADDTLDWAYYEKVAAANPRYVHTGALGRLAHQIAERMFEADPEDKCLGYAENESGWWALIIPAECFEGYHNGVPAQLAPYAALIFNQDGEETVYLETYTDAAKARRDFEEMR